MTGQQPPPWHTTPTLVLDLETTGVDPFEDRIVTAALVRFGAARPHVDEWLVNPGIDIPEEATEVHKITTDHARRHGKDPADVVDQLTGLIAYHLHRRYPLVVFNAPFDLTMLEAEARRHGVTSLIQRRGLQGIAPIIDPMVLANHAEPYRKKICGCGCGATDKTLAGWCQHYGVPLVGAHGAAGDATAAGRLWPRILDRNPRHFRGYQLAALHVAQADWRRAQADRLRAYFDKVGQEHDGVDGSWPIRLPSTTTTATTGAPA